MRKLSIHRIDEAIDHFNELSEALLASDLQHGIDPRFDLGLRCMETAVESMGLVRHRLTLQRKQPPRPHRPVDIGIHNL